MTSIETASGSVEIARSSVESARSGVNTASPDRAVVLHGIPWATYVALRDTEENWNLRMTYDHGELEIVSPSPLHERLAVVLGNLVEIWALELDIPLSSFRTMTVRREALERGFEPDNCYYVEREPLVWNKTELDFDVDPPPDLAIEVEVSRDSPGKMPIYASFGVPELWRVSGRRLQVHELAAEHRYVPRDTSLCLPDFPITRAQEVLLQLGSVRQTTLLRSFRDWVRQNARRGTT
ncbi:MAG: Uma2 family endonuclease [Thermoguttaceae bacterium]|jgi:Uma2 family endonuclease